MSITIERDPERPGGYRIADATSGDVRYTPLAVSLADAVPMDARTFDLSGAVCTAVLAAEMARTAMKRIPE